MEIVEIETILIAVKRKENEKKGGTSSSSAGSILWGAFGVD
jgi:hypothetical protein